MPTHKGSFRLFKLAGITVFLHWSWFLVVYYQINRQSAYSSVVWNIFEYLALFVIVTMHEFGHSLACRSVGGQSDQIVLWPLGGVAYVSPPQRPGAMLWSIAAGPLVNVVLVPILTGLMMLARQLGWPGTLSNVYTLIHMIWMINFALLIFNMMPVYPLDGGQILRSVLWFFVGRARSLMVTAMIGFLGVAALIVLAVWLQSVWIGIMTAFILMNCWGGLMQARMLARQEAAPRHSGFACPSCGSAPPRGEYWLCPKCRKGFDTFLSHGVCPGCGTAYSETACPDCRGTRPIGEWVLTKTPPPLP
jgi:Zn-dependent protease